MAAAALLAAGWAVQAAASCPVIPPAAPAMTATISSSSAATVARVTVAEPRSAAEDGIRERLRSGVARAGGLDVPHHPAGADRGEGDRPAGRGAAGAAAARDDLGGGDGDGDRPGGQVTDH